MVNRTNRFMQTYAIRVCVIRDTESDRIAKNVAWCFEGTVGIYKRPLLHFAMNRHVYGPI